ncbi:MAG: hypothetical protein Q9160_002884 [Pyrenula sp. 1 TL-2023]
MAAPQPARDFNSLRKKIRDMIWDAAVRNDLPAAHVFSVSGWEDCFNVDDDCVIFGFNDDPARNNSHYLRQKISVLTADRKAGGLFSLTANNPSAYLQDGGLWTACRESRAAMKRSQKKRDWSGATCTSAKDIHNRNTVNSHKSMSGYFNNNGIRQYFAIGPNDLVCFQPDGFDEFDFGNTMPFFKTPYWKPNFLQHFAFEFDSNWSYPEDESPHDFCWRQGGVFESIGMATVWEGIHIWLIDYGIQRDTSSPSNSAIRNNRQAFYGSGCRYVEVQASDPEWVYPRLEGSNLPGRPTALYFAEQLDECMKDYERFNETEITGDWFEESCREIEIRAGASLGVLACEYKW